MEERIIVSGKVAKSIKPLIIGVCSIVLALFLWIINFGQTRVYTYTSALNGTTETIHTSIFENMNLLDPNGFAGVIIGLLMYVGIILIIGMAVYSVICGKISITVTDKRVFGTTTWNKRVDLPLDKISAVATSALKGIAVATSSGRIVFLGMSNRDEIHDAINKLLMERQSNPKEQPIIKQEISQSNADELRKFKDLLDSGIITQEEFDAKKKQLLGL